MIVITVEQALIPIWGLAYQAKLGCAVTGCGGERRQPPDEQPTAVKDWGTRGNGRVQRMMVEGRETP